MTAEGHRGGEGVGCGAFACDVDVAGPFQSGVPDDPEGTCPIADSTGGLLAGSDSGRRDLRGAAEAMHFCSEGITAGWCHSVTGGVAGADIDTDLVVEIEGGVGLVDVGVVGRASVAAADAGGAGVIGRAALIDGLAVDGNADGIRVNAAGLVDQVQGDQGVAPSLDVVTSWGGAGDLGRLFVVEDRFREKLDLQRMVGDDAGQNIRVAKGEAGTIQAYRTEAVIGGGCEGELDCVTGGDLEGTGRFDGAQTAHRSCNGVTWYGGEDRLDAAMSGHAAERIARQRALTDAVDKHVFNDVAGTGGQGKAQRLAMIDGQVATGSDRAARLGAGGDGVGQRTETGLDGVIGRDVGELVAADRADGAVVDQDVRDLVAEVGSNRERVRSAAVDIDRAHRVDGAAGADGGVDAVRCGFRLDADTDGVAAGEAVVVRDGQHDGVQALSQRDGGGAGPVATGEPSSDQT